MVDVKKKAVYGHTKMPKDGQVILYWFEPFGSWHVGTYHKEEHSVSGRSGFCHWSDVGYWMDGGNVYDQDTCCMITSVELED